MTILLVVAIGLLSLSSVSIRSSNNSAAQMQAQANAKMALMIAIGELQQYTGADTRVTAPSTLSDPDSPPLLGAWRSWEGSDHTSTGLPITPDYNIAKKQAERDGGRFLKWLVSGAGTGENPTSPANHAASQPQPGTIPMLAQGTLQPDDPRQVHLTPTLIEDGQGGFAWWISGENQKARLLAPDRPANDNPASWADTARSHAVPNPAVFGLGSLHQDPSPAAKAITLGTADLIADPSATTKPHQHFLDFSTTATGLLTNTATGGWRKDMSLVTENWERLPSYSLPFFRISPLAQDTSESTRPSPADPQADQAMLYPWSNYTNKISAYPYGRVGPVSSWHSLMDYATLYKRITSSSSYDFTLPDAWDQKYIANLDRDVTGPNLFKHLHMARITPVISRVQWILSHQTRASGTNPSTGEPRYAVQLAITPVLTLWNPYNVSITSPGNLNFRLAKSPPFLLKYYRSNGTTLAEKKLMRGTSVGGADPPNTPILFNVQQLEFTIQQPFTLQPGETIVYSPNRPYVSGVPVMEPGYRPNAVGYVTDVKNSNFTGTPSTQPNLILEKDDQLKVDVRFGAEIKVANGIGSGIWLDVFNNNWAPARNYNVWRYLMVIPTDIATKYWPPISNSELASQSASTYANKPRPFLSTIFGSRMSSDTPLMDQSLPKSRGLLQSNPLMSFTQTTNTAIGATIKGTRHPLNRSFDYNFIPHTSANDSRLPNVDPSTKRGYIATGPSAANGLSRMILCELPLRPLASLAELQHWDMRSHYPYPPFQLNIIGNSDATPLIPSDQARVTTNQHDDSYCANHVLFDDWFFSSIAPVPESFGAAGGLTMRQCHELWLDSERPLTNQNYRPIAQDQGLDDASKAELIDDLHNSDDGWQRTASHIEVDGMFNVNSTSVAAWRAILGHCHGQKIPYHTETSIRNSPESDHLFSRSTIAADVEAGKPGGISGEFPNASEFTGYHVFEDTLIDALAEQVVEQVKLRGPFLSLSEFINRQLSNGDPALAGALQTALNQVTENAFKTLKDPEYAMDAGVEIIPGQLDDVEYRFTQAALGKSTYGLPGWIRQADVLRPIAPILSARDDTFTIRAYGDHRNATGKITARAWCEAVVRRDREFVEPAEDEAESIDPPQSPANERFGRRYEMVSFRWLTPQEI